MLDGMRTVSAFFVISLASLPKVGVVLTCAILFNWDMEFWMEHAHAQTLDSGFAGSHRPDVAW